MSAAVQVALALGSVAVLLGLMGLVRKLSGHWDIGAEMQRKMVHIGTGLYAIVLPWLFPERWPVYLLVGLTLIVMLVLRLPNSKLGGTLHGVERQSYGDILLAVSVGLCLFLADEDLYLYVLPIAVLTLADAAAALAGSTYGTRFFKVEDGEKSLEGSAVFFTITLLLSVVCLMLMTPFAPLNIIILSLMVAAFGTLVEAASWRGFDNLFLPMGLLIFLSVHGDSSIPDLLALAGFFALSLMTFKMVSTKIGLSSHAARVYVISVFLVLAVTETQNALFPILVLAAHAWSRSAAPCNGRFADLDIVASLALMSFGWLALGNSIDWNAISFYGMTAMGLMAGLCALAVSQRSVAARVFVLGAILLAACGLRMLVLALNPEGSNWAGAMWPAVIASLALSVVPPSLFPQKFSEARVSKLTGLALLAPLGSYLYLVWF